MKTLLHIGMGKTGTTALQHSLASSRPYLLGKGVLYPKAPRPFSQNNHQIIVARITTTDRMPRDILTKFEDRDDLMEGYRKFIRGLREQVAETTPEALVISGESLFRPFPAPKLRKLRAVFDKLDSEASVIAYVRKPSERFVSYLQQALKYSFKVRSPEPSKYRGAIEAYARVFGRNFMHVRCFARDQLIDGDIISDFTERHLAPFGVKRAELSAPPRTNETISAESTDISRRYRLAFHPDKDNRTANDSRELVRALQAADAAVGAGRPKLKPEVAELLDYSNDDPLWLRDQYGIVFSDFDYARIERGDLVAPPGRSFALDGLIEIDPRLEQKVLEALRAMPWAQEAKDRLAWIDGMLLETAA